MIAIWDDDSGKSHDDFMEGISFSMKEFAYFERLGRNVVVTLKHQQQDGHVNINYQKVFCTIAISFQPARLSDHEIDEIFKIRGPDAQGNL